MNPPRSSGQKTRPELVDLLVRSSDAAICVSRRIVTIVGRSGIWQNDLRRPTTRYCYLTFIVPVFIIRCTVHAELPTRPQLTT